MRAPQRLARLSAQVVADPIVDLVDDAVIDLTPLGGTPTVDDQKAILADWDAILASQKAILACQNANVGDLVAEVIDNFDTRATRHYEQGGTLAEVVVTTLRVPDAFRVRDGRPTCSLASVGTSIYLKSLRREVQLHVQLAYQHGKFGICLLSTSDDRALKGLGVDISIVTRDGILSVAGSQVGDSIMSGTFHMFSLKGCNGLVETLSGEGLPLVLLIRDEVKTFASTIFELREDAAGFKGSL